MAGKVGTRRCHHADIDNIATSGTDAVGEGTNKSWPGESTVPAHDNRITLARERVARDGLADLLDRCFSQTVVNDTADIVGLKYFCRRR